MNANTSQPPHEACASSTSPDSSPMTPGADSLQDDPVFTNFGERSSTLDGIGAWSSVQGVPSTQSAAAIPAYNMASDIHALGTKYSKMGLVQNHATLASNMADAGAYAGSSGRPMHGGASGADVDYSELDEAILRGRSTTLPNIFAVPNPLYRFSTAAATNAETGVSPGTISPASSSFGMLSRHGSISVANSNRANSNRTVSPLGLSLNSIPIHQTTSLDNQLTSPLEPSHAATRLDILGSGGLLGKPTAALSGSVSSTSSLAGIGNTHAGAVRRFSEFSADHASSLALSSYTMGSSVFSGSGGASIALANSAGDGINYNGASHDTSSAAAAFAPQSTGGIHGALLQSASQPNARSGSAYAKPGSRFGGFGNQLPTMREDDGAGELVSSPSAAGGLMRNASFPNVGSPARPPNLYMANRTSSPPENTATTADTLSIDFGAFQPPHVNSMNDVRRPSLDTRADHIADLGLRDQTAYERSAGLAHQLSFGQMPGMPGTHRRHSLASANMQFSAPGGLAGGAQLQRGDGNFQPDYAASAMPFAANAGGEYAMYASHMHPGLLAQQSMLTAGLYPYGMHPSSIPRQNSTSALHSLVAQQHFSSYQPHPGAIPLSRAPGASGMAQHSGGMPRTGLFGGPMAYPPMPSQQSIHSLPSIFTPAHMQGQPQLFQPVPMPQSSQAAISQQQTQSQQQAQSQQQQHMRRASHPGIPRMGTPAVSLAMVPPVPVLAGSTHPPTHPMMPNPATTITPNMPFADMGKGLPYPALAKGTRVFVVRFKGRRSDLYFAPNKRSEMKAIPTLAPGSGAAAKDTSAMPVPAANGSLADAKPEFEPGAYVLVEADRGVDLGVIREELLTADAVLSFNRAKADLSPGGFSDQSTQDGRQSTAPVDADAGDASPGTDYSASARPASGGASGRDVFVKRIFRLADQHEISDLLGNKVMDEQSALSMCQAKVQQRKLSMCVVDAEFQFDRRKLTFYFTADRRVDFRELVRDLFKHFKTRIWMCQQT
ncbi:hypothetical protein LPJ58_002115 [Coemansia sp. RSA 1591]|nr:hypothetical protein LPJ58_002115 [Coemansia sp. RSA 1591]